MRHVTSVDDAVPEVPAGSSWQALRDLAFCTLVVCAIALIVSFLTATSAHAQAAKVQGLPLEPVGAAVVGDQRRIAGAFFDLRPIPEAIRVGEAVLSASP